MDSEFAENVGHKVTQCFPSLVPMETKEPWICELQGLSLRNVEAKILDGKKELYKDFGEMLFTQFWCQWSVDYQCQQLCGPKNSWIKMGRKRN